MILKERQDEFIAELALFESWPDKYNHIISLGQLIPSMPWTLQSPQNRIESCISRTFFYVDISSGYIQIYGSSNAAIPAGIIGIFRQIFNGLKPDQVQPSSINFHITSGLYENLTYNRRLALNEMLRRIISC